jgi:hypothetical protein
VKVLGEEVAHNSILNRAQVKGKSRKEIHAERGKLHAEVGAFTIDFFKENLK